MDRVDSKFTFKAKLLPAILKEIEPFYSCLQIDEHRISNLQNLYYDTPDLNLYKQHHNNKLNRYKVRHRTYLNSGLKYLEIKFKNNKDRTIKKRIEHNSTTIEYGASAFLETELPFNTTTLKPMVWVNYSRITLISKHGIEKLTIDLDLKFETKTDQYNLPGLVIAEIKQHHLQPSYFLNVMKNLNLRREPISKYCFAIAFAIADIKKNNFKQKLINLKQIIHHDPTSNLYRNFN